MDKTIRRNTNCVIGMPRCDFVFSSTRTCFIAYGFEESALEMRLLRHLLQARGIQPIEAAGKPAPGQNAFCAKICSKIITAQFCIAIVNNSIQKKIEVPNANVNVEYGLMLGFNKFVIPFQRKSQKLPFNTAPLDTIKYTPDDFERLATDAIAVADDATRQDAPPVASPDQIIEAFLLAKRLLITPVENEGTKNIFYLGQPLGFNLLNSFSAQDVTYFGNFTALRPELIIWRVNTLVDIINERRAAVMARAAAASITNSYQQNQQAKMYDDMMKRATVFILVTTAEDKATLEHVLAGIAYTVNVFCLDDIGVELQNIGRLALEQADKNIPALSDSAAPQA